MSDTSPPIEPAINREIDRIIDHFAQAERAEAEFLSNRFAQEALARHKREGLELALRARWFALAIVAVMLPFLIWDGGVIFYHVGLILLAMTGWAQWRVGGTGRNRMELALLALDLMIMTVMLVMPNPLYDESLPSAVYFRFETFIYFFIILIGGALTYSWRTIGAIGLAVAALWFAAVLLIALFGQVDPALTTATEEAFGVGTQLTALLDPNSLNLDLRGQQIVVFVLCAFTLATVVARFDQLLLSNAVLARERANLTRYFSPNVVEELSQNDEPLKSVRAAEVAVLFVDVVNFTGFAQDRDPTEVIGTLRAFHGLMEREVFGHGGTLDKYLGDGLMATFGSPVPGPKDASNALACAKAMVHVLAQWNTLRARDGDVPIDVGIGVAFGPVVLGDIGKNRLEFSVIGNCVNLASRLEKLTRELHVHIAISDAVRTRAVAEKGPDDPVLAGFTSAGPHAVRGLSDAVEVWVLA